MNKITTNQALERWDTLPEVLREALYSEAGSDFLWKTCEDEHIPEQKIYGVSRIAGYVLMGFLHPEDVAEELKATIGIDPKTAATIQTALNQRIFAPLRQEIDRAYAPVSKFEAGQKSASVVAPQMISVNTPSAPPRPPAPPAPPRPMAPQPPQNVFSQLAKGTVQMTPVAGSGKIPTAPPAPKPPLAQPGWSNLSPEEPVVKLNTVTPGSPYSVPQAPKPPQAPANAAGVGSAVAGASSATVGGMKNMSEFERLDIMKKATQAQAQPQPQAPTPITPKPQSSTPSISQPPQAPKPSQPAPMMLHEVGAPSPLAKASDVHFSTASRNEMSVPKPPQAPTARAAVLELGKAASGGAAAKVVNYSEQKNSAPPPTVPSSGPRQITEITGNAPAQPPQSSQAPARNQVTAPPPPPPKPPQR